MKKVKKVLNLIETVENTYNLREKIKEFLEVPDNVNEGYVPYANILDEKDDESWFTVIFAKTLSVLKRSFLVYATYRLNWHRFPVVVVV